MIVNDKLTKEQISFLKEKIRKRDKHRCILCSRLTNTVHEIIPKSHGAKRSKKIFRESNMCCLCTLCHMRLHFSIEQRIKKTMTQEILIKMFQRYGFVYK